MKMTYLCFGMALTLAAACPTRAQSTAFTYQGRLNNGASPANGSYDLTFALYDSASGPTQQGNIQTNLATGVTNGLITVMIDFGNQFPGSNRWLEIGVRTNGGAAFAILSPRQQLTPTPYALYAPSAGSVAGSNIIGSLSPSQLPTNVALLSGGNTFTGDQIMNGNVGIGTGAPDSPLTVATPVDSNGIEHTDGNRVLSTFLSDKGAWFGTESPDPFYLFANNGGPALTIGTNGNVSIGTPFPGASSLQINAPFVSPFAAGLQVNDAINGVDIQINRGPNGGGIGLLVDNAGTGDASTSLLLLRNNVGSSLQTMLDVQADGKVGIQSSTPGKALQIGDPAVIGSEGMIRLSSRTDTGGSATRTWDIGVPQTSDNASGIGYSFVINDVALGSSTPQLLVQWGTGNVGIGTTNPAATLDVNGTVQATQFHGPGALSWQIVSGTNQQAQPNTGYFATNSWQITVTLPPSTNINPGDIVRISGLGSGGWKLQQNSDQSVFAGNLAGNVGAVWTAQVSDSVNWTSIASSADGTKLVAASLNAVYTSSDSGVTWSNRASQIGDFVASSADGTKLVVASANGVISTSTDSGVTWTSQNSGSRHWTSVASSADGTKLVATDGANSQGLIYISGDSGVTWTPTASALYWRSVASSADGSKLVAVGFGTAIYTSIDSGVTWTPNDSSRSWTAVASSSDGTQLVAADGGNGAGGLIYTSSDSGLTWTPHDSVRLWDSVASSADGSKLVAAVQNGYIYTSINSGTTWLQHDNTRAWESVASSADGTKLAAVVNLAPILTSSPTPVSNTSLGGSLMGGPNTAIELQYAGNGQFVAISQVGNMVGF